MKVDSMVLLTAITTQGVDVHVNQSHVYKFSPCFKMKIVLQEILIFQVSNCDRMLFSSNVST